MNTRVGVSIGDRNRSSLGGNKEKDSGDEGLESEHDWFDCVEDWYFSVVSLD